jgi:predicted naringenin-chalcone synthase
MANYFGPVLADFTPVQVAKPVPQRLTLELSAYGFAKAHCNNNGITDKDGFRRIHKLVKEKIDKYALSPTQIRRRQLVFFPRLNDIRFSDGEFVIAPPKQQYLQLRKDKDDWKGVDIKARHESYRKVIETALNDMYEDKTNAPDDLIHVTCSGYLAPSPVERMAAQKEWFDATVTHSYHMGCYGAFPAIRMAHGFLSSSQLTMTPPKERVDIIHTELLSAHQNLEDLNAENIITMTLFADGLIRYSLYSEEAAREKGMPGLKILAFNEHLLPNSADDMTWVPGPHQFLMTLTPMVPVVIKNNVRPFVENLLHRACINLDVEKERLCFAIHPGGPRIVEHLQEELGLQDEQVERSKIIFRDNGNMSSATVPYILKDILGDKAIRPGTPVVCLAFGPGLTVTGLVLEKI